MKKYRTFKIVNDTPKLNGIIELRYDDEDRDIFRKLKEFGFKLSKRKYFIDWGDDTYLEVINKKTFITEAFMELVY